MRIKLIKRSKPYLRFLLQLFMIGYNPITDFCMGNDLLKRYEKLLLYPKQIISSNTYVYINKL